MMSMASGSSVDVGLYLETQVKNVSDLIAKFQGLLNEYEIAQKQLELMEFGLCLPENQTHLDQATRFQEEYGQEENNQRQRASTLLQYRHNLGELLQCNGNLIEYIYQNVEANQYLLEQEQTMTRLEGLANFLGEMLEQTQSYLQLPFGSDIENYKFFYLATRLKKLLQIIIMKRFIVVQQPDQIFRVECNITETTVHLYLPTFLRQNNIHPTVEALLVNEAQARGLHDFSLDPASLVPSATLKENTVTMKYDQESCNLIGNFRPMKLTCFCRPETKKSVLENKFALFFRTSLNLGNSSTLTVWTLSVPAVVTVNSNQNGTASAVVAWDNAFALPGRLPFEVPGSVSWPRVASMLLSSYFERETGRGLTEDNLAFLAAKLYGETPKQDLCDCVVSWELLAGGDSSSFWNWFFAALKATKKNYKDEWRDGLIMGFVDKAKAKEMLLAKPAGTFLLRFTDSTKGGLCIDHVRDSTSGVISKGPFTSKELEHCPLSSCLNDFDFLYYLYPDKPKKETFGGFRVMLRDLSTSPTS